MRKEQKGNIMNTTHAINAEKTDNPIPSLRAEASFNQYAKEISGYSILTREEEHKLSTTIRKSKNKKKVQEAINKFITHNLRLVISMAMPYNKQVVNSSNLNFSDLVSAGNIGLRKAALKFNSELGYKFSTYAHSSIKHEIWACINDDINTVRVPRNHREVMGKINKYKNENADVSLKDLSEEFSMKENKLDNIITAAHNCNNTISLDAKVYDDQTITRLDTIADDYEGSDTSLTVEGNDLRDYFLNKLHTLSSQEHITLFLYFFSCDAVHLREISEQLGVTIERVRQILIKGINKLKGKVVTELKVEAGDNYKKYRHSCTNIKHATAKGEHDVRLSYDELKSVAELIDEAIIGDNSCIISKYKDRVRKFDILKLNKNIRDVIKNDMRLLAFFPKDIYRILKKKVQTE